MRETWRDFKQTNESGTGVLAMQGQGWRIRKRRRDAKVFKDALLIRSPPLAAAGARNLLCSSCNYGFHACENQQKVF